MHSCKRRGHLEKVGRANLLFLGRPLRIRGTSWPHLLLPLVSWPKVGRASFSHINSPNSFNIRGSVGECWQYHFFHEHRFEVRGKSWPRRPLPKFSRCLNYETLISWKTGRANFFAQTQTCIITNVVEIFEDVGAVWEASLLPVLHLTSLHGLTIGQPGTWLSHYGETVFHSIPNPLLPSPLGALQQRLERGHAMCLRAHEPCALKVKRYQPI